jgi:integrase
MTDRIPAYVHHKPSGQARVRLGGRDHYLGAFNSPESRAEYDRVVAEWLATGRRGRVPDRSYDLTVTELLAAFTQHAEQHYRKNDRATGEASNYVYALGFVRRLYGHVPASEFRGLALKTVRDAMIAAGHCRLRINRQVGRIKHVWKWAVANEMVPPETHQALAAVEGLARGRTEARESMPVRAIEEQRARGVLRFVAPEVRAMIELQLLTGMRPGEVVTMRGCDLDTTRSAWVYRPAEHKTEHHGVSRQIALGPRAQQVIQPFRKPDPSAPLFSPKDAAARRHAERRQQRTTPLTPSQRARKPKKNPDRAPSDAYTRGTYANAIRRACLWSGVAHWHPNQLRHTAATKFRKAFGLEVARAALGHRSAVTTERYAEMDVDRVADVMRQVG